MRSSFQSLLLPSIAALILSACAATGDRASAPAVQPSVESAVIAPVESAPAVEAAPVEPEPDAEVLPLEPAAPVQPVIEPEHEHDSEPAPAAAPPQPATAPAPAAQQPATAPAPAAAAPPSSPYIFNVTAGNKDETHPSYGVGHRLGFVVNGVQGKPLVVVRGKTYSFHVNAGIQHDFYLSTSDVGWGGAAYTSGVTGQFVYEGVVTFKPGPDTPDLLYYQCRNHKNMGGPIYVVNEGQENTPIAVLAAARGKTAPAAEAEAPAVAPPVAPQGVTEQQLRQKIQFADMFIHQSAVVARIERSGNVMAQELHRGAKENLAAAQAAMKAGDEAKALAMVQEATRMMSEAGRLAPQGDGGEAEKLRFEQTYESVQAFSSSYERSYKQAVKAGGKPRVVNLAQIKDVMNNARDLADDGKYNEAISMLGGAQETLTTALNEMLHEQTIVHELKFDTPRDEYEYELSRYQGYEALVPLAIRQKNPNEDTVKLMTPYVDRAKEVKALSEPQAAKGNYSEAILMLQGATSNIERALQIMGVR